MLTSLFTGVSGLNANMTSLSVIGNNIANMNTVGFKSSRASFADILSQTLSGAAGSAQVGLGVNLSSIMPVFSQGAFETTNNGMDMAIDGEGFFVTRDTAGAMYYTRAGQFNVDRDGYIINPEGYFLRGYQADTSGNISTTVDDILISTSAVQPNATTAVDIAANINSDSDVKGFVFTTANDDIVFNIGGANITAQLIANGGLASGTAYTGSQVAAAIKTALEAQNGVADTYTVSYTASTGKFTVANDSTNSNSLNILWTNAGTTAETMLGFTADDSIAVAASAESDATGGNFDVAKASDTSNFSTTVTVYDSLGKDHQLAVYFRKSSVASTGNTWTWYGVVDGADNANSTSDQIQAQGTLAFNTSGQLTTESSITYATGGFDFSGGATQNQQIAFNFGTSTLEGGAGIDGVTQYGQTSAVYNLTQDGYSAGSLQGMSIDAEGIITGTFSNGRTRALGQVVLADFSNPAALTMKGKNLFAESTESGQPLLGTPSSAGKGTIHASALELSTVDLAAEFVKMISAQRGFQANSKIITTTDEILSELVNLKR